MKLLSHYLGSLGGVPISEGPALGEGQRIFEAKCFFCHATEANWPMERLVQNRTSEEFYEKIGRLPEINPIMPPFGGTDEERILLAEYLAEKVASTDAKEGR